MVFKILKCFQNNNKTFIIYIKTIDKQFKKIQNIEDILGWEEEQRRRCQETV